MDDEATTITVLARSEVPDVLRQLRQLRQTPRGPRTARRAPAELQRLQDLWWRIWRQTFGRDEISERAARLTDTRLELGRLLDRLAIRIDHFLNLAALAGSPPEYQQDLRDSRIELARIADRDPKSSGDVSAETFQTLSHIVDLVTLTRRDIQRRALDDPVLAARFVQAHLPAEREEDVAQLLGVDGAFDRSRLEANDPADRRVKLLAQLIYDLRYSHTPEGLLNWFTYPFAEFDHKTPLEILDDPEWERPLRAYARSLRGQAAT